MPTRILNVICSNGVRVALLRDKWTSLHDCLEIDVLIDPANAGTVKRLLTDDGWIICERLPLLSRKFVAVKWENGTVRSIDVHTAMIQNGFVYMPNQWYFDNSVETSSNQFTPNDNALFCHLIFHVILGKSCLDEKYADFFHTFSPNYLDIANINGILIGCGIDDYLPKLLKRSVDILSDESTVKLMSKSMKNSLYRRHPSQLVFNLLSVVIRRVRLIFGPRRGISICFIGPDGAGKSTFIQVLTDRCRDLGLPTRSAYMGPWDRQLFFTTKILEYFGCNPMDEIAGLAVTKPGLEWKIKYFKGVVRRYLYYLNVPFEFLYRYIFKVYGQLVQGRMVLMDRYIYDLQMGYKNRPLSNGRLLRRIISMLMPAPDIGILLYNNPRTIWERKREYQVEDIEWAMKEYIVIAERYRFIKVKTDEPCDILVDRFLASHWREIYSRR